jgi:hypothetical protein
MLYWLVQAHLTVIIKFRILLLFDSVVGFMVQDQGSFWS